MNLYAICPKCLQPLFGNCRSCNKVGKQDELLQIIDEFIPQYMVAQKTTEVLAIAVRKWLDVKLAWDGCYYVKLIDLRKALGLEEK